MSFWKTTAVYGIGFIFLRAISFLLLPLYTNLLSQNEVGWVFIIYTILAFLNVFYTHGMNAALFKFFHSYDKKEIITTSLLYSIISSMILSLVLFLLYGLYIIITADQANFLMVALILIVAAFDMISYRNSTILRLLEKPYYYLFVCFMNVILSITLNIYFIKFCGLGIWGAINALVCVSLIQFLLLTPVIISFCNIRLFNKKLFQKMIRFGLVFFPAALFFILIELSDRWMLGYLRDIHEVGIYGAGYKIGSIIMLMVNSFNLNWQPYYLKSNTKHNIFKLESIGQHLILILVFMSTVLSIMWPLFFQYNFGGYYLVGENFWEGGYIIPVVCLSYIFYGLFILQMPSLYLKSKQNWAPIFWGSGFIINLLINFLLIPKFGMYGAAWATFFAYFFMSMFLVYKNQSWFPIQYQLKNLGLFCLFSGINYYLAQSIYQSNNIEYIYVLIFLYSTLSFFYIYNTTHRLIPELD